MKIATLVLMACAAQVTVATAHGHVRVHTKEKKGNGSPCSPQDECDDGLQCLRGNELQVAYCQPLPTLGEICGSKRDNLYEAPWEIPCEAGLTCFVRNDGDRVDMECKQPAKKHKKKAHKHH